MNKKILWITQTAAMLALLIALQYLTKSFGQFVTGSCVNAIIAIATLFAGLSSGLTIALVSPILAYLLGIAPQILVVPAIMVGNSVYSLVLNWLASKRGTNMKIIGCLAAAACKFGALYLIVSELICGLLADTLLAAGSLKQPMLQALPATFSWPQLVTAIIGGSIALLIVPTLRKALQK